MPVRICPKRNETSGAVPTAAQLATGELAMNTGDGKMWIKRASGAVVEVSPAGAGGGANNYWARATVPSHVASTDLTLQVVASLSLAAGTYAIRANYGVNIRDTAADARVGFAFVNATETAWSSNMTTQPAMVTVGDGTITHNLGTPGTGIGMLFGRAVFSAGGVLRLVFSQAVASTNPSDIWAGSLIEAFKVS